MSVTNFEAITQELNESEKQMVPFLIQGFKKHTEANPITAPAIITQCNAFFKERGLKLKLSEPRLRKCCNYIRSASLLPLIATSEGYYISTNPEIIQSQIKSLQQRANSILTCAVGLQRFLS